MSFLILGFVLLILYFLIISIVDKLILDLPFGVSISINGILFAIIFVLFSTPVILKINNVFLEIVLGVFIFYLGYNTSVYIYHIFKKGEQGEVETDNNEIIRKMSIGKSLFNQNLDGYVEIDFGNEKIICKNISDKEILKGNYVVVVDIKDNVMYVEKVEE